MSVASSQSLRHDEAIARASLLQVTSYDVVLDLVADEATFGSVTTVTFESGGGPTFVDLKPATVLSIRLNDADLDADGLDRGRLPLPTTAGTNVLVVDARMPYRNDGEGLHRHVDPADGRRYVYGMSFMDAAPTVFACFDQPDLKAPYTVTVHAPRDWVVMGNAPAGQVEPGLWRIGPTRPLSTYFTTVVAGPYHVVRDEHDGIPLGFSCRQSLAPHLDKDLDELVTVTRQSLDALHGVFGIRYPFGDYHQAFVPEFNAGAMENPGCVTIRDPFLFESRVSRSRYVYRASLMAHEMAHQWFGNILTPRWWDDLWLNESFAEYLGWRVTAEATDYTDAWDEVAWARRTWGLSADQRPTTHPVAGNGAPDAVSALQNFDGISYARGSAVLKQLCATLGDEAFFGGAVDLMTTHRFGNAALADLVDAWQARSGTDLTDFVRQWLRIAGPDTFTLDRAAGTLRREAPADHPADRSHTFDIGVLSGGTLTRHPVRVTGPVTDVPAGLEGAVVLDPDHDSWGLYVPDAATMRALVTELPRVEDTAVVAAAWNNVKSGYSVAAVDPDVVVDLAVAAFPVQDGEDTARHTVPWLLGRVLPAAAPGSLERLHAAAVAALDGAAPGSEEQLAALRASIRTADDESLLRGWLEALPDGVDRDLDLRWRALVRLASLGFADVAELDAALADDDSTVARVAHTQALAARPTAAAKEFAWERFTGAVDVPNYELEAAAAGMWQGGQHDLTEPYVERYVTDLPGTAQVRSGWVLALAAEQFFPSTHVEQGTLDAVRGLLARDVLEPAVRRRVLDRADDLERTLAVRAAFPAPFESVVSLARRPGPSVRVRVTESTDGGERSREDRVAVEEPLEIRLEWPGTAAHRAGTTMRTPGHDFELAAGWVHHEGLAGRRRARVAYCTDDDAARPSRSSTSSPSPSTRRPTAVPHQHEAVGAGSSACGVCGRDIARRRARRRRRPRGRATLPDARRRPTAARRAAAERSASSTAPAGCTPPALATATARCSSSARTSAATTPSTRSPGRGCWPATPPPRRAWWSAAGPASSWCRRRSPPASARWSRWGRRPASPSTSPARGGLALWGFTSGGAAVRYMLRPCADGLTLTQVPAHRRGSAGAVGGPPTVGRMRLLHTSDWHLGRSFHREGMLAHQAAFVDHLLEVVESERVDLVLVAGDVYDRALPPVDAVALCRRGAGAAGRVPGPGGAHQRQPRLRPAAGLRRPGWSTPPASTCAPTSPASAPRCCSPTSTARSPSTASPTSTPHAVAEPVGPGRRARTRPR